MGVAVIIRNKELGLSVVAIHNLRNRVPVFQEALSQRLEVGRRPVELYAMVILRPDRSTSSLIEPEIQPLVMNHASDESTVPPHGAIHRQPKPVHPEAQTLLEIGAGNDWNAGFNEHLRSASSGSGILEQTGAEHRTSVARSLLDQGFDSRRQFKNGIGEWLVAHGLVYECSTVVACPGGVSGGDQGTTKIPIVLENGERERLGRV